MDFSFFVNYRSCYKYVAIGKGVGHSAGRKLGCNLL